MLGCKYLLMAKNYTLSFGHIEIQNHCMAQNSTKPFIHLRSIKRVPGTYGHVVVKSNLSPCVSTALKQLNLTNKKGAVKFLKSFLLTARCLKQKESQRSYF